jgi:dTDP-4-amino-4,6-dideoxygalactose transaminase
MLSPTNGSINLDFPNLLSELIHENFKRSSSSSSSSNDEFSSNNNGISSNNVSNNNIGINTNNKNMTLEIQITLQKKLQEIITNREIICINRYSNALYLSLKYFLGYDRKLNSSSEVICPEYCSRELQLALKDLKINVLFVKCDINTGLISLEEIEKFRNSKTIAVIGYHAFGLPCHVGYLPNYCSKHNIKLIYDGGEFFYSKYNNFLLGSFGDLEIFSTESNSFLSSGNGAIVCCKNKRFTNFFQLVTTGLLRHENRINVNLDVFSSLVTLTNLKFLNQYQQKSKSIYLYYVKLLLGIPGVSTIYFNNFHTEPNYHVVPVIINEQVFGNDTISLCRYLWFKNIDCKLHYKNIITLPGSSNLTMMNVEYVVAEIKSLVKK